MTVTSCRVAKHVADGDAVVSRVVIRVDGVPSQDNQLRMAILQRPYRRTFGFLPISAWVWHPDTLTSWHRMRQRLGTAPAIFDEETTDRTDRALQRVMQQQGYLDAVASHRVRIRNGKALVTYDIKSGRPRRLASIAYMSADTTLQRLIDESPSMPKMRSTAEMTAPVRTRSGKRLISVCICGRYPRLHGQILLAGSLPS